MQKCHAKLEFIDHQIDPETRSARFRTSIPNPEGRLKAGMFVRMVLEIAANAFPDGRAGHRGEQGSGHENPRHALENSETKTGNCCSKLTQIRPRPRRLKPTWEHLSKKRPARQRGGGEVARLLPFY